MLNVPKGVEVTSRENEKEQVIFVLNHNEKESIITLPVAMWDIISKEKYDAGPVTIAKKDVKILTRLEG